MTQTDRVTPIPDAWGFAKALAQAWKVKLCPLPRWCNPALTRYDARFREMPTVDSTSLALRSAETLCLHFAKSILPVDVLRAFSGLDGRYALALIACGGSLAPYPDLQRTIGIAEWQALRWLHAQPAFASLVERYENAFFDWCAAQEAAEAEEAESATTRRSPDAGGDAYQPNARGYWHRCVRRMCGTWRTCEPMPGRPDAFAGVPCDADPLPMSGA
ncbi:hypothetical protein [Trinickia terrae]|uniref:hypothetical protein n=1 Tax=Trinickia terrae TaxID=2571161 RepID=UPI00146E504A|nr:hypothetical protein [Trinickia terrae]